ncbi:MAG: methyltransferase domain-containing protein [Myxococcales bacterium]
MPEWYETFFGPLALEFWDKAVPPSATAEEVDFLVRNLAIEPPARLLDLPCGPGRHALLLAGRGYRVTGIDIAQEAIEWARRRARELGVEAEFVVGDMRNPPPAAPYDGAYCLGNSFGYLSHEDTRRFVRNVLHAVRPGGRWIIDTGTTAESLLAHLPEDRRLEAGGIVYSVRNSYDALSGRLNQACVLEKGEVRQEAEVSYGIYTVAELHRLLFAEGWNVEGAYGSLDGRPFQLGDRRLLLVAGRR